MTSASHMTCSIRCFTYLFVVNVMYIYKGICINGIKLGACHLYLWALLYRATLICTNLVCVITEKQVLIALWLVLSLLCIVIFEIISRGIYKTNHE